MRSSLGFHTLSLFLRLSHEEVERLIKHFCTYRKRTGLIRIRMPQVLPGGQKDWKEYTPLHNDTRLILPLELKINYSDQNTDRGIKWTIRADRWNETYKEHVVRATINPKVLRGIPDYITAATYDDLSVAITNFNLISKQISPVLGAFEQYTLQRIDYCVNFALNELVPGCSYGQMIDLIKRSDIPPHYKEWMEYDSISHRTKSKPGSFYLMNGSANINCYSKYMKFQDQSRKNIENRKLPISQATMDAALDIIRFEVQCKYRKVYALSHRYKETEITAPNLYQQLLAHENCIDKIENYFKKTIGRGDWYTLQEAIRIVKSQHFNKQKEDRLIKALKLVNDCRSVARAKEAYQGHDLDSFKRTLNDLASLGINPVTIPKYWGIKHIPNLLNIYFYKLSKEKTKTDVEEFQMKRFERVLCI